MNVLDIVLVLVAALILYLAAPGKNLVRSALLVLAVAPALFLAVEGATEMLTCDETYMIREITDLPNLSARQWNLQNYRTSMALTGNIVSALRAVSKMDPVQAKMAAKAAHWLLGLLALVA